MASDLSTPLCIASARAAVEGVVASLAEGLRDGAWTLFVLETSGDALRASVPLPPPLRRWLRERRDDDLVAAARLLEGEVPSWSLSAGQDDPSPFDFALRRRDQAASALAALAWRFVSAPPSVDLSAALEHVDAALRAFDLALAGLTTRAEVEARLGDRRALEDTGWRAELPGDVDAPEESVEPGVEFLDAWLREGRFARYVQRHADRDADFADRLRELVVLALRDADRDRSLPVGFVARRWLQQRAGAFRRPTITLHRDAPVALAAATARDETASTTLLLGMLAPLAASASIERDADAATLHVWADEGVLARVSWGGVDAVAPAVGEPWKVTLPARAGSAAAVVVATDGARVEFDVELGTP